MKKNNTHRFLVADDSVFARQTISDVVQSIGGVIAGEASNGREAVDKYFELRPDMLLMDISMPVMEGTEALGIIMKRDSRAKVIMVSALDYEDIVKRCLDMGARNFISKPVHMEKASAVIKSVMDEEGGGDEG